MNNETNKKDLIPKIMKIMNDKKIQDPIKKLLDLEKKFPSDIPLKQAIGQSYLQKGENTEALNYMKEALKIEPNNYSTHFNLGRVYQKFKKFDEAIKFYKKSISINKKFKEGYNILGDIYFNKKDFNLSVSYYKSSFDLDKTKANLFAIARLGEGLLNLYLINNDKKLINEAKEHYEFIDLIAPNNLYIKKNLININHYLGLKNEAIILEKKMDGVFIIDKDLDKLLIEY